VKLELRDPGHNVVAMDLPCDDDSRIARVPDMVIDAIDDSSDLVPMAQSFRGFTTALVCKARAVRSHGYCWRR